MEYSEANMRLLLDQQSESGVSAKGSGFQSPNLHPEQKKIFLKQQKLVPWIEIKQTLSVGAD